MRTKQALTQGLFSLLGDNEFRRITVSDICAAAHVSRPTFYTYFEDKYSLLTYCIQMICKDLLKSPVPDKVTERDRLKLMFDQLTRYQQTVANCLIPGGADDDSGSIVPGDESVPELVKLFRLGGSLVVFCWWALNGGNIPREKLVDQLVFQLEQLQNA